MTNSTPILSHENPGGGRSDLTAAIVFGSDKTKIGSSELNTAIQKAVDDGLYFESNSGGLGDVIVWAGLTDLFARLDNMTPNQKAVLVITSSNPDAAELFKWHPKFDQILIVSLGFACVTDDKFREKFGLPIPRVNGVKPSKEKQFVPYPSNADKRYLSTLPSQYVAFSVISSDGRADGTGRTVPEKITHDLLLATLEFGLTPVFLGRNYKYSVDADLSPGIARSDPAIIDIPGVIYAKDKLSAAGTVQAIYNSTASVVCNSSGMCASWFSGRPTYLLWSEEDCRTYYPCKHLTFGLDYPKNTHVLFERYTRDTFFKFLHTAIEPDTSLQKVPCKKDL